MDVQRMQEERLPSSVPLRANFIMRLVAINTLLFLLFLLLHHHHHHHRITIDRRLWWCRFLDMVQTRTILSFCFDPSARSLRDVRISCTPPIRVSIGAMIIGYVKSGFMHHRCCCKIKTESYFYIFFLTLKKKYLYCFNSSSYIRRPSIRIKKT